MELEFPIHHVIVVGFHHKKGCQIEYAYPPFEVDIENTAWKYLPTLAMPDGAHNFTTDTVYFHLPSLKTAGETVFGVACYQQIDAEKVKNKSDEVTRSTIQKSVCVLSKYPLFGHIQVKMSLITAAYFREGDFEQVSILEEAYHNLNACLTPDLLETPETFVGLSPRDLIVTFRHEVLVLLKLLLLEKRILFRGASVGPLCSALLTLVSLLPLTLEYGLKESACVKITKREREDGRHSSIVPQFSSTSSTSLDNNEDKDQEKTEEEKMDEEKPINFTENGNILLEQNIKKTKDLINTNLIQGSVSARHAIPIDTTDDVGAGSGHDKKNIPGKEEIPLGKIAMNEFGSEGALSSILGSVGSIGSEKGTEDIPDFITAVQLTPADAGLPLKLFTKGYLCHPYLSLHYMDLLSSSGVRGFIVGATNILFKQKRDLGDVIVEMQDGSVEISDPSLKKLVTLSTEDLRFAENLVRNVTQESSRDPLDNFLDGVGWEGGDEWIRAQFKYYLMCLMRTSQLKVEGQEGGGNTSNKLRECFGPGYIAGWQDTNNWKVWNEYVNSEERDTPGIYLLSPGHPYSGQMSMSDMKLRLAHTMQKTESGRKINQAVGKAVASTGKAVGGAFSQAKGALSNWWSSVSSTTTTSPQTGVEIGSEDVKENDIPNQSQNFSSTTTNSNETPTKDEPKRQSVWFTQ